MKEKFSLTERLSNSGNQPIQLYTVLSGELPIQKQKTSRQDMEKPIVLAIGGSDSSGGAGIQADIKAITAMGCHPLTVVTAVTAQNTQTVLEVFPLDPSLIESQLDAVFDDFKICAIKIGMLATKE